MLSETVIYRLPTLTMKDSLKFVGVVDFSLGSEYPEEYITNENEIDERFIYSVRDIKITNPKTGTVEDWYIFTIQKFYHYPFKRKGETYREFVYYLTNSLEREIRDQSFWATWQ